MSEEECKLKIGKLYPIKGVCPIGIGDPIDGFEHIRVYWNPKLIGKGLTYGLRYVCSYSGEETCLACRKNKKTSADRIYDEVERHIE